MTIGVHDYDFFHYEHVIPNLDVARLITYYRQQRHITVLTPMLNCNQYTKFIIRKEYDDGVYPKELYLPDTEYGGRAFTPNAYKPFAHEIEQTIPDMHIYDKYTPYFGSTKADQKLIKRILNCAHIRLAPDSQNILPINELKPYFNSKITGIILHDYDLARLKVYDVLKELQDQRYFVSRPDEVRPLPIGNKYPIKVYNSEELRQWLNLVLIPNAFLLEYCGLMDDRDLYDICLQNKRMAYQIYYNISASCSSENDFLINRLPNIFLQCLFLRRYGVRILLKYNEGFFVTKELENLVKLLNCFLGVKWQEGFMENHQTLYSYCRANSQFHYTSWSFRAIDMTVDECRDVFQYIRERNYDLFKLFYEIDTVQYEGGKFIK